MFEVFRTVGPQNGLSISCSRKRWKHVQKHKEMEGQEAIVEQILRDPIAIYQSDTHQDRHVFYGPCSFSASKIHVFVRIVVEYRRGRGRLITAFAVSSPKPQEQKIWSKP